MWCWCFLDTDKHTNEVNPSWSPSFGKTGIWSLLSSAEVLQVMWVGGWEGVRGCYCVCVCLFEWMWVDVCACVCACVYVWVCM